LNNYYKNADSERSRAWVEIDLAAINHNLDVAKKMSRGAMVMAAIKSNAYAHGAVRVAKAIEDRTDYFGVASPEEALELREAGVETPIVILGGSMPIWNEKLISNRIIPSIFTIESAKTISAAAVGLGNEAEIMIALDTGMERIGFADTDESADCIRTIASLPGIKIHGIFTHLACADMPETGIAEEQIRRFRSFCHKLEESGVKIGIKSVMNSAGTALIEDKFDLVRIGIALYGYSPAEEISEAFDELIPAMSVRAVVTRVKEVPAGTAISYGHTYKTERASLIATVGIGYADGLPRALSSRGSVIINGKPAKITGRICMDQLMVDVTDIPGVKVGSVATVMGKDGNESITAEDIADLSSTISYEIICGFDRRRMPKIYK